MTHTTVISAAALQPHLTAGDWVVFDCRFDLGDPQAGYRDYRAGHLPGAHYAHLDERLSSPIGPDTGRHPLPDPVALAAWLGECGVQRGSQVVVYDALNGAVAARLWWLLRWLGHEAVAVLDGGFKAWVDAGNVLEQEVPSPRGAGDYPAAVQHTMAIEVDELQEALQAERVRLLDARAPARFRGETEPLDRVAGHVPGAVNLSFSENLAPGGRYLKAAALRERLARAMGPFSPADTVCMCGSGVTACHTLLAMEMAGLSGARLYAGSWSEWIADPQRPVATGN